MVWHILTVLVIAVTIVQSLAIRHLYDAVGELQERYRAMTETLERLFEEKTRSLREERKEQ
jgi:hypothetical protein